MLSCMSYHVGDGEAEVEFSMSWIIKTIGQQIAATDVRETMIIDGVCACRKFLHVDPCCGLAWPGLGWGGVGWRETFQKQPGDLMRPMQKAGRMDSAHARPRKITPSPPGPKLRDLETTTSRKKCLAEFSIECFPIKSFLCCRSFLCQPNLDLHRNLEKVFVSSERGLKRMPATRKEEANGKRRGREGGGEARALRRKRAQGAGDYIFVYL